MIIVSEWVSVLHLFRQHLHADGYKCAQYTGEMTLKERENVVTAFNQRSPLTNDTNVSFLVY